MSALATDARVVDERVFRAWDYGIFAVLTLVNVFALVYFVRYWVGAASSWGAWAPFALVSALLAVSTALFEIRWVGLPFMVRPRPLAPAPGLAVAVVTTFVPGAEPLAMLEQTVKALVAMDYPHDTWVLDEGDDPDVRALCDRLGAHHFSRKGLPRYQAESGPFQSRTKHGNYNAWLHEVGFERYEILVAFDPDHVPVPGFLTAVLGYFRDPEIGYVQAAQVYYNQPASFIARGAAEETYAYYSSLLMGSYSAGLAMVVGCHNAHRMSALREVGGFAPHDADDLVLALLYSAAKWRGVYVPHRLAEGLTPVDWKAYFKQQRRWARSVLDVKIRIFPALVRRLPTTRVRLVGLVHGLHYLASAMTPIGLGVLVAALVTGGSPVAPSSTAAAHFAVFVGALMVCDLYRQRFFVLPRSEWGVHWRAAFVRFAKWPHMAAALWDAVRGQQRTYVMTAKVRPGVGSGAALAAHSGTALVIAGAWVVGTVRLGAPSGWLDGVAALLAFCSLLAALTQLRAFPEPFDLQLSRAAAERAEREEAAGPSPGRVAEENRAGYSQQA